MFQIDTFRLIRKTIKEHAANLTDYKGEWIAIKEMRKHAAWYTAGMPHSTAFRVKVNTAETLEELFACVDEMFEKGSV